MNEVKVEIQDNKDGGYDWALYHSGDKVVWRLLIRQEGFTTCQDAMDGFIEFQRKVLKVPFILRENS